MKCGKFVRAKGVFWYVFFFTMIFGLPIIIFLNNQLTKKNDLNINDFIIVASMVAFISVCNALIVCNKAKTE